MKPPAQSGDSLMKSIAFRSSKKAHVIGMVVLSVGLLAIPVTYPKCWQCSGCKSCKIDGGFERPDHEIGSAKN